MKFNATVYVTTSTIFGGESYNAKEFICEELDNCSDLWDELISKVEEKYNSDDFSIWLSNTDMADFEKYISINHFKDIVPIEISGDCVVFEFCFEFKDEVAWKDFKES
jgi:hypothetical protein